MGIACQQPVGLVGIKARPQQAERLRVSPRESAAGVPNLRRLGQVICLASLIFSGWMYWSLGSFVASQF